MQFFVQFVVVVAADSFFFVFAFFMNAQKFSAEKPSMECNTIAWTVRCASLWFNAATNQQTGKRKAKSWRKRNVPRMWSLFSREQQFIEWYFIWLKQSAPFTWYWSREQFESGTRSQTAATTASCRGQRKDQHVFIFLVRCFFPWFSSQEDEKNTWGQSMHFVQHLRDIIKETLTSHFVLFDVCAANAQQRQQSQTNHQPVIHNRLIGSSSRVQIIQCTG